ncbi:MAG: hypothetical protein ACF8NJ_06030 [Phycisphaerales bacterium JB038]
MPSAFTTALVLLSLLIAPAAFAAATPTELRVEYLTEPLGLDVAQPRFSWINTPDRRGAAQSAYQIRVASDPGLLRTEAADLWDSRRVDSAAQARIRYQGRTFAAGQHAWWSVRIWNERDESSPWSAPAHFSVGLLGAANWRAHWIEDPTPAEVFGPANNGYHSQMSESATAEKWITIDLGAAREMDGLALWPARPYNWSRDEPGFLFPKRFLIEAALTADFTDAVVVVDRSGEAVAKPGTAAWRVR